MYYSIYNFGGGGKRLAHARAACSMSKKGLNKKTKKTNTHMKILKRTESK